MVVHFVEAPPFFELYLQNPSKSNHQPQSTNCRMDGVAGRVEDTIGHVWRFDLWLQNQVGWRRKRKCWNHAALQTGAIHKELNAVERETHNWYYILCSSWLSSSLFCSFCSYLYIQYIYMFVNCLSSYCFPLYFGFWSVRAEQHTWYQVAWLSRRVTRTICCPLNRSKRFPRLMRCFHLRTEEPEIYFLGVVVLHLLVVVHNVLVHKSHALGVGTFKSSSGSCGRRAAAHVGQFAEEEGKIQMIQQKKW